MTSPQRFYRSLEPGQPAPAFSAPAVPGFTTSLDNYRNTCNLLVVFYHADFIHVGRTMDDVWTSCAVTLWSLSANYDAFMDADTSLLGISRASIEQHVSLVGLLGIRFPLLTDVAGDLGVDYGVLPENRWAGSSYGYDSTVSVFLIDRDGILRYRAMPDVIRTRAPLPSTLQAKHESSMRMWLGTPDVLDASVLLGQAKALKR